MHCCHLVALTDTSRVRVCRWLAHVAVGLLWLVLLGTALLGVSARVAPTAHAVGALTRGGQLAVAIS